MKLMNKIIVPVTASALLLGACGSNATESKDNTLISSKAGDVKVADVMKKIGNEQIATILMKSNSLNSKSCVYINLSSA